MAIHIPSHPDVFIPGVHFKQQYYRKPSSGMEIAVSILAHTLKGIAAVIFEITFHQSKLPGAILFSRLFLFALLMLSGIACHAETPIVDTITSAELTRRLKESNPPIILDVRTREEYSSGHIDTAVNLPHDELEHRFGEIPGSKSDEIIVYCRSGKRARVAESILAEKGYTNVKDLTGHWQSWNGQAK
ncbi:MAG: rhodanese-like domain-containing protein [Gallionella sp.]|nr:rhodanese-like domain-containing protein [Gallionella sp.]